MKTIVLISVLLLSNLALSCPDLTGSFKCPAWNENTHFNLEIKQTTDSLGVTVYEFKKEYLDDNGKSLNATDTIAGYPNTNGILPPPVPTYIDKEGLFGRCINNTLVVDDTVNRIDDSGDLVAEVNNVSEQLCQRLIWPPKS